MTWTLSVSAVVYSSLCVRLQLSLFRWKEYALKCTHLFQNTITPLSFPEKTALQSFHHPLTDCVIHFFSLEPCSSSPDSFTHCLHAICVKLLLRGSQTEHNCGAHKHPDPVEEVQFVQFVYGVNVLQPQSDPTSRCTVQVWPKRILQRSVWVCRQQ